MKYYFYKTDAGLMPMENCKPFDKLEIGEEIEIDITSKRNIQFHKKFFALIKLAFDNQDYYTDLEDLRKDLIKVAGFYENRTNFITGEIETKHNSISFSSMNNDEFQEVYNKVLQVVSEFLNTDKEELINELLQF